MMAVQKAGSLAEKSVGWTVDWKVEKKARTKVGMKVEKMVG